MLRALRAAGGHWGWLGPSLQSSHLVHRRWRAGSYLDLVTNLQGRRDTPLFADDKSQCSQRWSELPCHKAQKRACDSGLSPERAFPILSGRLYHPGSYLHALDCLWPVQMEWISSLSGFPDGGSLRPPVALVSRQGRCRTVPRVQAVCAINTISAQPWISGASSSC